LSSFTRRTNRTIIRLLPKDHTIKWVPCVKTHKSSLCACPASYIHSTINPSHCIPSYSRCLKSCKTNPHCVCYHLKDENQCHEVTHNWIAHEVEIGPIQRIHELNTIDISQSSDHSNRELEHLIVDTKSGERLFF